MYFHFLEVIPSSASDKISHRNTERRINQGLQETVQAQKTAISFVLADLSKG
jgi:hypothetical protein